MDRQAVIYARVSSKEQAEGYSIEAQTRLLWDYALKRDLKIAREFIEIESAKATGRPEFNSMLSFIDKELIPIILVEKTDRLYRNIKDYVKIDDLKVEVHLVKEGEVISKSSSAHQKFFHGIKLLMARNYIDNLSEETRKGMNIKAEKGGFPRPAPIGYLNNRISKTIEIDPEKAPLVRQAFNLYASCKFSLVTLTEELNHLGLRNKVGGSVTKHGIEKVLKNPFYYGYFNWKGKLIKGAHKSIITKSLFDKTQKTLSDRNKPGFSFPKPQVAFPFRGLMKCGYCGCSITAELIKKKFIYYRCTFAKGRCNQKYYRQEKIDEMFADALKNLYIDDEIRAWAQEALQESHKEEECSVKNEIKRLQNEYTRNESKIHQVYQDKLGGLISEDFFKAAFNRFQERQAKIDSELKTLRQTNLKYMEDGLMVLELVKDLKNVYLQANLEQRARLLKILLYNCELKWPNPRFYWNKPFDLLVKLDKRHDWQRYGDSNPGLMAENHLS